MTIITMMKKAGEDRIAAIIQTRGINFLMLPRVHMYRDLIGWTIATYLKINKHVMLIIFVILCVLCFQRQSFFTFIL